MKKISAIVLLFFLSGCITNESNISSVLGTATTALELVGGMTYSEQQAAADGFKVAKEMDAKHKLAPEDNKYYQRLDKLFKNHQEEDGIKLNYHVYLSPNVNAFALPNGDIRVYQGLMDLMTDEEILFVIGHEIAHVKLQHSRKKQRLAKTTNAALKGLSMSKTTQAIGNNSLTKLAAVAINSQFSQSEETAADLYSLEFMHKHGYNPEAAVSALKKLGSVGGEKANMVEAFFASHPESTKRADLLQKRLNESGL
ncbi:MAG: M48 family metalloprotease [Candidatus Pacebacteria bacterium]|nr:M48 family metalloprotease [Candidatus Paceibacterota bacterium]